MWKVSEISSANNCFCFSVSGDRFEGPSERQKKRERNGNGAERTPIHHSQDA